MAPAKAHTRSPLRALASVVIIAALALALLFVTGVFNRAQGTDEVDSSTIGIGATQAQAVTTLPDQRFMPTANAYETAATATSERSITVHDPSPVVVPLAVDTTNEETMIKAREVATLNPLPTAPRVSPDLNDGTWSSGVASAYNISSNDDGNGNFGVTDTASGVDLTNSSVTVAVPQENPELLGSAVEICYNGDVVIATVTDVGGFGPMGRVLDLAPGTYKAFGFSSASDWGTREVYYRFL